MFVLACIVLVIPSYSFAEDEAASFKERMKNVEERVEELEREHSKEKGLMEEIKTHVETMENELDMVDYRTGRIRALKEKVDAFSIGGDLSLILQGILKNDNGRDGKADGSYSADLFLIKPAGPYGNVFFRGDIGQGDGIAPLSPPTFSGPNADLEFNKPSFELVEAWYWTQFPIPDTKDRRLELTAGKMDPTAIFDTNKVANSENSQFLANIFVNNPALEFGGDSNGYGAGLSTGYRFTSIYDKGLKVIGRFGLFEGDGDFKDIMDRPFIITELDINRPYYGLDGNYRFYAWTNQRKHTDLLDPAKDNLPNKGFGLSIDQKVSDDVTLFARYGLQDKKVSRLDQVFTVGGQLIGNSWRRGNDAIGVAYGASHVSKKFKAASPGLFGYEASASFEHYIEAYYKYWANKNLSISPDIQYIVNPGGDGGKDDIFIYGVRAGVAF